MSWVALTKKIRKVKIRSRSKSVIKRRAVACWELLSQENVISAYFIKSWLTEKQEASTQRMLVNVKQIAFE